MMATKFLSSDELVEYVQTVAKQPKLWRHLVEYGENRSYKLLADTPRLNCWVITWNVGHDTGIHDHDGSAGGVVVVEGIVHESRLYEESFEVQGSLVGCLVERGEKYEKGGTFQFGPSGVHRVKHHGKKPAVTIHAYSPPLSRMGSYGATEDGEFIRLPVNGTDELKPLEQAVRDVHKDRQR